MARRTQLTKGGKKINRSADGNDLSVPLLEADSQEDIAMTGMSRRKRSDVGSPKSAAGGLGQPEDPNEAYLMHILEPHHTLAGIALQYRVTVEQLMRANHFFNRDELHTKKEIKVPVKKHGALYADPEAFRTEEAIEGSATHTTARPVAAATFNEGVAKDDRASLLNRRSTTDGSTTELLNDTEKFLSTFDDQMQTAITAMDNALQQQMDSGDGRAHVFVRRSDADDVGLMKFYPKDWRVLSILAIVALLSVIPILYYLLDYVKAPGPAAGGSSHGSG